MSSQGSKNFRPAGEFRDMIPRPQSTGHQIRSICNFVWQTNVLKQKTHTSVQIMQHVQSTQGVQHVQSIKLFSTCRALSACTNCRAYKSVQRVPSALYSERAARAERTECAVGAEHSGSAARAQRTVCPARVEHSGNASRAGVREII